MKKRTDEPRMADSVSCGVCDFCSAVHINLLDERGDVFASASVPADVGEEFIAMFRKCLTETATRLPAPERRQ